MKKLTNNQLAFLLARITIGINFLMHGLVRLPKLSKFSEGIVKEFSETILPQFSVQAFAFTLPFIELLIGFLLIIGFKTRLAAASGFILMAFLILGTSLREDWALVGSQMIYVIFFFMFIKNLDYNTMAVDANKKTKVDGFKTNVKI